MATLKFTYGAMNSGKSTKLLQTAHNYLESNFEIDLIKPAIDTKGDKTIVSRLGISQTVDILWEPNFDLLEYYTKLNKIGNLPHTIFVDEAQFLTKEQVLALCTIVDVLDVNVKCYGIKLDYLGNTFIGSAELLAKADYLESISSICSCGNMATENLRYNHVLNSYILEGEQIAIDNSTEYEYITTCRSCAMGIRGTY